MNDKADKRDINRPSSLKNHIHAILYGTDDEKENLRQRFFYLADTPKLLKNYLIDKNGNAGEYFSVSYGTISRHKNKDENHNLTEQNWIELCEAVTEPFAIAKHGEGYRLFTNVKVNDNWCAVGVEVKNIGKGIEINSIKTAFGYKGLINLDQIIYTSKKITPEQMALLKRLNSSSYPPNQGLMS